MFKFDIEGVLELVKYYQKYIFQLKSHQQEVFNLFQYAFVKNHIFAYLTLKLTFWPWN